MITGKISGTFVDFSELTHRDRHLLDWGINEWREELQDMVNAGIDTAILARAMRFGLVYYYSDTYETHEERDYIEPFMRAAEEVGIKVFISGLISDFFFTADDSNFRRMMKRDVNIYSSIISELLEIYAASPALAGIYISHEADNENMASVARLEAAKDFFGNLYANLKQRSELPIVSSPFFTKKASPEALAEFWRNFLDRPMFDILAMQDGVGCDRDIAPENISEYYAGLAPVFQSKGVKFWNNVESFSFNPGYRESGYDRSKIWLKTAPFERIDKQYRAGCDYVEKTVTWEFGHFLGRRQAGDDFYNVFRNWNLSS